MPNLLYKYCHEDRTDVLENGVIRYTQPREFNDPFELLPYIKALADEEAIAKGARKIYEEKDFFNEEFEKHFTEDPRFKSCTDEQKKILLSIAKEKVAEMRPELFSGVENLFKNTLNLKGPLKQRFKESIINSINDTIGILCLTETYENFLMWSHYSNSHKGFVIGFDKDHQYFGKCITKKGLAGFIDKVRYTERRPEFIFYDSAKSDKQNSENWIRDLIWIKSIEWKYEDEWRIINTLKEADQKLEVNGSFIYLFRFPLEAVKTIYLGCKMENAMKDHILSIASENKKLKHVDIIEVSIHEQLYKLEFKKIN